MKEVKTQKMQKELIEKILKYIEQNEHQIEREYGEARELNFLIENDKMPFIYYKLKELLNDLSQ